MTKGTALTLSVAAFIAAAICWYGGQAFAEAVSALSGIVLLGVFILKDLRDDKVIAQAKQEREASPPPDPETILVVQKTSSRLFVPSPLHEHHKEIKQ